MGAPVELPRLLDPHELERRVRTPADHRGVAVVAVDLIGVGDAVGRVGAAPHGAQAVPVEGAREGQAHQLGEGGGQVHGPHLGTDALARGDAGARHDQGHVHLLAVEHPVGTPPVTNHAVVEPLAVVARDGDDEARIAGGRAQALQQATDLQVQVLDLARVEADGVVGALVVLGHPGHELARGHEGGVVRVPEVDPQEEGVVLLGDPGEGPVHGLVAASLEVLDVPGGLAGLVDAGLAVERVEVREALVEAEAPRHREGRVHRAGGPARLGEGAGQGGHVAGEAVASAAGEHAQAVPGSEASGQDGGVGHGGHGGRGHGVLEQGPALGEAVEDRGPASGRAVAGQVVGPGRVQSQQEHAGARLAASASTRGRQEAEGGRQEGEARSEEVSGKAHGVGKPSRTRTWSGP